MQHLPVAVNWDEIDEETIRPGVRRKIYSTPDVMLCWHHLSRGMVLRPHSHDDFDQLALILEGEADYYVDEIPHRMRAGSMLFVPAKRPHYIEPVTEFCINIDVFAPPRKDYEGSGFRAYR
ncbi:cupin domain-containing protein [Rhodococcus sp. IEGM 1318]|uniref:cupin domain-containing protein n=1 Tax=Rhodococcus sp. IEGM 1318 TaxID=3082226 RepID=UPI0029539B7C|nr:cupin domain-containing protein [Rhodococcus sp. IEGM 1318]MDV8009236.1 cupin domain-containing protein [Rhodococcus sp. IEGM 1318]